MNSVEPMLATTGPLPTGPGWAYELKWDGVRAMVDIGPDEWSIRGRRGNDVGVAYPELAGMAEICPDILLDGEIVTFVDGRPSFGALQSRMHVRSATQARRLASHTPVNYLAFDVLRLYGVDLTARPYSERRATLDRLGIHGSHWTVPPSFDDGPATAAAAKDNGLEGVVAKRLASPYRPGVRSTDWVKVRFGQRQEFVVGGWEHGEGNRAGGIGSLLLGYYRQEPGADRDDRLVYAGQVGTGFTERTLAMLGEVLAPLVRDTAPFESIPPDVRGRAITWVEPEVVVDVGFAEWTGDGRLRFAVYQGLRNDRDPREVHRE
jgi:bifunctional non-homologous end joining protein LigD